MYRFAFSFIKGVNVEIAIVLDVTELGVFRRTIGRIPGRQCGALYRKDERPGRGNEKRQPLAEGRVSRIVDDAVQLNCDLVVAGLECRDFSAHRYIRRKPEGGAAIYFCKYATHPFEEDDLNSGSCAKRRRELDRDGDNFACFATFTGKRREFEGMHRSGSPCEPSDQDYSCEFDDFHNGISFLKSMGLITFRTPLLK